MSTPSHEEIAKKAYEIFQHTGNHDAQANWLMAEASLKEERENMAFYLSFFQMINTPDMEISTHQFVDPFGRWKDDILPGCDINDDKVEVDRIGTKQFHTLS
jgi:hypothetical protein